MEIQQNFWIPVRTVCEKKAPMTFLSSTDHKRRWHFQIWILKIYWKVGTFIWHSKLKLKIQIETFNIKLELRIYKGMVCPVWQ